MTEAENSILRGSDLEHVDLDALEADARFDRCGPFEADEATVLALIHVARLAKAIVASWDSSRYNAPDQLEVRVDRATWGRFAEVVEMVLVEDRSDDE